MFLPIFAEPKTMSAIAGAQEQNCAQWMTQHLQPELHRSYTVYFGTVLQTYTTSKSDAVILLLF